MHLALGPKSLFLNNHCTDIEMSTHLPETEPCPYNPTAQPVEIKLSIHLEMLTFHLIGISTCGS